LRYYDDYYLNTVYDLNREKISLSIFNKNRTSANYNSFILGSSRTIAFKTKDWNRFLNKEEFRPFVFDAYTESLQGITSKVEYLEQSGVKIDNVLIVICSDVTFSKDPKFKNLYWNLKHPSLSGNSYIEYYFTFIKTFFSKSFFVKYYDYKIFNKKRNYMSDVFNFWYITNDKISNDLYVDDQELKIIADSAGYYKKNENSFYVRAEKEVICSKQITNQDILQLKKIIRIFNRHNTNYRIIISPLYDQKRINPADLKKLTDFFGKEYVYDFSGKNEITMTKHNYIDNSHFRYHVGRMIMKEIYVDKTSSTGRLSVEIQD